MRKVCFPALMDCSRQVDSSANVDGQGRRFQEECRTSMSPSDKPTKEETAYLLGLNGALAGRKITAPAPGSRVVLGRDPAQCQVVLDQNDISRRHAMLEADNSGNPFISDLGSRCGTFVNGK